MASKSRRSKIDQALPVLSKCGPSVDPGWEMFEWGRPHVACQGSCSGMEFFGGGFLLSRFFLVCDHLQLEVVSKRNAPSIVGPMAQSGTQHR